MAANQKVYFEGIDDIMIVMMKEEDTIATPPVYDEQLYRLPIATKLGVKGNGSTKVKYASSKVFRRVSRETEHELSLEHVGIPIEVLDKIQNVISNKGVVFKRAMATELPYFAFGFIGRISDGERMAVWYPKVQMVNATESEYVTAEEDDEIKDVKATFTAGALLFNDVLNSAYDSTRMDTDMIDLATFIEEPIYEEKQLNIPEPPAGGDE
ncbi:major tail protein [Brochothrix campestris]|uniref:Major tail protein, phi13 family n=1 Tax=Brochothrix campestris FSL F6-1037 TaxID=1265861 RepID=W7CYE9_9LIST|nr:major tail protein [Brochothrix campestris]EUJ41977.1 major tail protein, phi13 family [Brochothrix campestris FSL F6-1037]